jgi:hypothetical protein
MFWDDHILRSDDDPGVKLSRSAGRVTVRLTDAQRLDLLSDATHYATSGSGVYGFAGEARLVASARRTATRVTRDFVA